MSAKVAPLVRDLEVEPPCPRCAGSGVVPSSADAGEAWCPACGGKGVV